ncbi:DNA-binding response regulator [Bacillus cereus]|nr:DNA-binding response regulator [Bacillus cereus]PGU67942.1 DNA-binding response regulator [Bacillus cereus]
MEKIIEVNGVSKTFKHKSAVNNVSFHVNKGEIVALLGPNGAGKTTTMSIMLGLKDPTEGKVSIFGKSPKHRDVRNSLGAMLQEVSVIDSITGEEALKLIESLKPDMSIMDIEMPIQSGLDVAETLKKEKSSCKVMILTTFARPGYFERAMKAGVHGYLLKDSPSEDLAAAIRNVMKGKREVSQDLMFGLWQEQNPLSDCEKEVLLLAKEGKTANEIAKTLYLSPGTVRNYISEVLTKLDAKNRIEAITIAEEKGWI